MDSHDLKLPTHQTCILIIILLFSSIGSTLGQSPSYNSEDMAKLNALVTRWDKYWNMHDMDSMGTLLTEDIEFINVAGRWLKGKEETVSHHKQRHTTVVFKTSQWTTEASEIKYLKPDLAILHYEWGLKNDFNPDGTPREPRHGIITWIVTKQNGNWLILAAQNTNKTY